MDTKRRQFLADLLFLGAGLGCAAQLRLEHAARHFLARKAPEPEPCPDRECNYPGCCNAGYQGLIER